TTLTDSGVKPLALVALIRSKIRPRPPPLLELKEPSAEDNTILFTFLSVLKKTNRQSRSSLRYGSQAIIGL
ncbi:hypothetical protein ACXWPT_09565, partial [Streptococcus pyogenes]